MKNLDLKTMNDLTYVVNNENLQLFFNEGHKGFAKEFGKAVSEYASILEKDNDQLKVFSSENYDEFYSNDDTFNFVVAKDEMGKSKSISSTIVLQNDEPFSQLEMFLTPLKEGKGYAASYYQYKSNDSTNISKHIYGYEVFDGEALMSLSSCDAKTDGNPVCKSSYFYQNGAKFCAENLYSTEDLSKQIRPEDLEEFRIAISNSDGCFKDFVSNCKGKEESIIFKQMQTAMPTFFGNIPPAPASPVVGSINLVQ